MALIGMGNNKLICFLIHLEKTDPERYLAIKRTAYGYIKEHAADLTYMNANITTSEALSIMEFIYGIIIILAFAFISSTVAKRFNK